jgi:hypothetical protein
MMKLFPKFRILFDDDDDDDDSKAKSERHGT